MPLSLGIFLLVLLAGCSGEHWDTTRKQLKSPSGYDLNKPIQIKLPLELDEISGLAYYEKDTSLLAINDEYGYLYKIFLKRPAHIQKWKFSDGADFEDLALIDSTFYVLVSTGDVIAFRFITADSMYHSTYKFPFGSGNEFEILYFDPTIKKLVMICKDCQLDKKKTLSAYAFDPQTNQYTEQAFAVNVQQIANVLGKKKMKYKPSAAAINPTDGNLYLISAINQVLAVTDKTGKAIAAYEIDNGLFKQPEGLTFSTGGTMIISNEAADVGVADILIFPYNKTQVAKP